MVSEGRVYMWTGGLVDGVMLADWHKRGAGADDWPEFQKDKEEWCRLVIGESGEVPQAFLYEKLPVACRVIDTCAAWGSGMDFAYGAMFAGADAVGAIRAANERDIHSGLGVVWFNLKTGERGIEGRK